MDRFIDAIHTSPATQNWYAALYLSLTLPGICARLESNNRKTNRNKFVAWFDKYLASKYRPQIGADREMHVFLSGNDCYALRCAMLHEGESNIASQQCREVLERFHFTVVGSHCNQINSVLQLDVPTFCTDVCNAVESWFQDFKASHTDKLTRIDELVSVYVGPHSMSEGVYLG